MHDPACWRCVGGEGCVCALQQALPIQLCRPLTRVWPWIPSQLLVWFRQAGRMHARREGLKAEVGTAATATATIFCLHVCGVCSCTLYVVVLCGLCRVCCFCAFCLACAFAFAVLQSTPTGLPRALLFCLPLSTPPVQTVCFAGSGEMCRRLTAVQCVHVCTWLRTHAHHE